MAYFGYLILLFLFTTHLSIFINCNSIKPPQPQSICPSFSCGDGLVLGYPFWQRGQNSDQSCGYPYFGISCSGQKPMLQLSDHLYLVRNLNYSENSITVAYDDHDLQGDSICPVASHSVTLNTTSMLLNLTRDDEIVHFFYNCTLYPPSEDKIKCLQLGAKHSYVFVEGLVPEFDWKGNCDSVVTVPIMEKGGDHSLLATTFGRALEDGFKLKWQLPDSLCQSCESSGGFCGYKYGIDHTNFSCFCRHGSQFANCHDDRVGEVSARFESNFLLIGATILGCLMTIFYVAVKKRGGTGSVSQKHKQGFSQIPSYGR